MKSCVFICCRLSTLAIISRQSGSIQTRTDEGVAVVAAFFRIGNGYGVGICEQRIAKTFHQNEFYVLGFTLDKESNTVAIICQDLIVVLAFDTRERLIQWQVKIYNHLGEGEKLFSNGRTALIIVTL